MDRGYRSDLEDRVAAPRAPEPDRLRDAFWEFAGGVGLGLVRVTRWGFHIGPIPLLIFGEPRPTGDGWRWPITGGRLARGPGGGLGFAWRDGHLIGEVDGYRPWLPAPLYDAFQLPAHHLVTRLSLLRLRGRVPPPGPPAELGRRLGAGLADLVLCAAAGRLLGLRRPGTVALAAGYHLAAWRLGGRTVAGALAGQKVVSVDGSALSLGQAGLRLLAAPAALVSGALHDRLAGTEVIRG